MTCVEFHLWSCLEGVLHVSCVWIRFLSLSLGRTFPATSSVTSAPVSFILALDFFYTRLLGNFIHVPNISSFHVICSFFPLPCLCSCPHPSTLSPSVSSACCRQADPVTSKPYLPSRPPAAFHVVTLYGGQQHLPQTGPWGHVIWSCLSITITSRPSLLQLSPESLHFHDWSTSYLSSSHVSYPSAWTSWGIPMSTHLSLPDWVQISPSW